MTQTVSASGDVIGGSATIRLTGPEGLLVHWTASAVINPENTAAAVSKIEAELENILLVVGVVVRVALDLLFHKNPSFIYREIYGERSK